jgi:hypothetical protein
VFLIIYYNCVIIINRYIICLLERREGDTVFPNKKMTRVERIASWVAGHNTENLSVSYADYVENNVWRFESIADVDRCVNEFVSFFGKERLTVKEILKRIENCSLGFADRVCDMLWDLAVDGVL